MIKNWSLRWHRSKFPPCFVHFQKDCETHCAEDQFQCHNNLCISRKWLCDGQEDCKTGEDERNCLGTGNFIRFWGLKCISSAPLASPNIHTHFPKHFLSNTQSHPKLMPMHQCLRFSNKHFVIAVDSHICLHFSSNKTYKWLIVVSAH